VVEGEATLRGLSLASYEATKAALPVLESVMRGESCKSQRTLYLAALHAVMASPKEPSHRTHAVETLAELVALGCGEPMRAVVLAVIMTDLRAKPAADVEDKLLPRLRAALVLPEAINLLVEDAFTGIVEGIRGRLGGIVVENLGNVYAMTTDEAVVLTELEKTRDRIVLFEEETRALDTLSALVCVVRTQAFDLDKVATAIRACLRFQGARTRVLDRLETFVPRATWRG
jgi:hypothetical protein